MFILVLIMCICWGQGVRVHVSARGGGFQKTTLDTLELKSRGCKPPSVGVGNLTLILHRSKHILF